jgi:5-methylcytosine-specific restriction endonuclease McrA
MQNRLARQRKLADLGDQITELAAHLDAGEYRFLVLIEAFDREEGWSGEGINSCAHWLNYRCGISIGVAREKVRVARALPELPQISKAYSEGRLSYSKVRAMTRVATPKNEDALLNVALHGTAYHVERQVRLYRRVKRREALAAENLRHTGRELAWHVDEAGCWVFRGRFTPEQGAVIAQALEAAMEAQFRERRDEPAEVGRDIEHGEVCKPGVAAPVAQRRADALERMAGAYLATPEAGGSSADRYTVNLHTDAETLKADGTGAEAELEAGGHCCHVPAETSRRLTCDAGLVHWRESAEGEPLSVGRKTRTIPPAIRRALRRRDGGCRFPGCSATRFVDAHHVRHWADGGETRMDNLVSLCRRHHRLVHEGGYGVEYRVSGEFAFSLPDGQALPETADGRSRGNVRAIRDANGENGLEITPRTAVPRWYGEKMDDSLAVLALVQRE